MWKAEEEFPRGKTEFNKKFHSLNVSKELTLQSSQDDSNDERKKLKRKKVLVSTQNAKRRKLDVNHVLLKAPLQNDIVTELSTTYTHLLKKLVDNEATDFHLEDIKPLTELFLPGMLIPVQIEKILEIENKKIILLTGNPSKLNSSVSIKALTDGMLLFGSISSLEDHGYSIDLGIAGLQAFLSHKNAKPLIKANTSGSPLCVGHPVWCVVQIKDQNGLAGENRVLSVSVDPAAVKSSGLTQTKNLNCFLPGMNLKGIVQKVLDCGLIVSVSSFQGHVHVSQLPNPPEKFSIGQQLNLKLLYVDVNSKVLQLTALPKIVHFDGRPIQFFADLNIGNIREAKVTWIQKKTGVYFNLPHGTKGFAAMTHLTDKKSETPDLQKFSIDSLHQCRILGFNYMEGLALIDLRKHTLQKKFFNIKETSVGDVIDVVVHNVVANGVLVKLAKSFFSFITCLHLADVPIKHPEKKFSVGKKLKCKVLKIDIEKNKVFLTHKKSLMKTKYPIISEYSQLKPHMELEGYISAVKDKAVIVSFFNDVKGFVTLMDMSTEVVNNPHDLFYEGQVIKCRVILFDVPKKKLKLSFNLGDNDVHVPEKTLDFSVQKINEADIVSVDSAGYTLVTLGKKKAFLPYIHLSDFHEVQELRKLAFKSGQRLTGLTFFKQKEKLIVTMKESFVTAAEQSSLIKKFQDLKIGMLLPAVIKNHQDYGMFLEIINGYTGLCPSKTLSYLQPSNLQELFQPGQSVITRLSKIDAEKQRFLGSIHMNECSESGVDSSLVLLKTYLQSRAKVHQQLFAQN
ncbi:Protein RRP5, partial [Bulinus truncatus]